jgi:hypothetical protein
MRPLRILTWHTHGSYLYYLTRAPHAFFVLSKPGRPPGYGGRCGATQWGSHVHDLPVEQARKHEFDCIIFQDDAQFDKDQYAFLSAAQRALPRIYIEHDPPRAHPTDTRHPVDDPNVLLVHVTHFNALMWDSGRSPVRVIEHGVVVPDNVYYSGELDAGLVIVNHLARRGRRLGADIFCQARQQVRLDLVGMAAEELGGLGEVAHAETGYLATNPAALIPYRQELLRNPALARQLGVNGQRRARERFGIDRFIADWNAALADVTGMAGSTRRS